MKNKRLFTLLLFMILILIMNGCTKKQKEPHEVVDYLKNLSTYQCKVEIDTKNDREELKYSLKQYCDSSIGYRVEIGDDKVQIHRNNKVYVKDLKNNKKFELEEEFNELYSISFVGEYIKLLYTNDSVDYIIKEIEGKKYQLIQLLLPGNNRNLYKAVMYVDLKAYTPEKIVIYDNKEKERVIILYSDFVINDKIDKSLFNVE